MSCPRWLQGPMLTAHFRTIKPVGEDDVLVVVGCEVGAAVVVGVRVAKGVVADVELGVGVEANMGRASELVVKESPLPSSSAVVVSFGVLLSSGGWIAVTKGCRFLSPELFFRTSFGSSELFARNGKICHLLCSPHLPGPLKRQSVSSDAEIRCRYSVDAAILVFEARRWDLC